MPPDPAGPTDLDDAWAAIVAGYHRDVDAAAVGWPAAEDAEQAEPPDDSAEPGAARHLGPWPRAAETERSLLDALDTLGADLPDEPDGDEGYTPPPAPPVPRPTAPFILGILGILGGLAVALSPGLLPIRYEVAFGLGVGALLAGVATLIWRLSPRDAEDEPFDDGAVV